MVQAFDVCRLAARPLRSRQQRLACVIEAIAGGQTAARDILAAVAPGGGKSLLPVSPQPD